MLGFVNDAFVVNLSHVFVVLARIRPVWSSLLDDFGAVLVRRCMRCLFIYLFCLMPFAVNYAFLPCNSHNVFRSWC